MKKNVREYFRTLNGMFEKVIATDASGEAYEFDVAMDILIRMVIKQGESGGKVLFIGNGASATISSHMATDFWKNGQIRAISFNDSALLTCISNDYGYQYVFEKPIEMFADSGDVLFAISSSGKSENIIRAVEMAKAKNCHIITLSGFDRDNPLRSLGEVNFYVPSSSYGPVEIVHHSICHCLLDSIVYGKNRKKLI